MLIARSRGCAAASRRFESARRSFCFDHEIRRERSRKLGTSRSTRDLAGLAFSARAGAELAEEPGAAGSKWSPRRRPAGRLDLLPGSQELMRRVQSEMGIQADLARGRVRSGPGQGSCCGRLPRSPDVREAAEGLWVPIRLLSLNPFSAERLRWPLRACFRNRSSWPVQSAFNRAEPVLDSAALGRAEQLASEIALRWARLRAEQPSQGPDGTIEPPPDPPRTPDRSWPRSRGSR